MSSPGAELPPRFGPFEIIGEVGRGAGGVVARARDARSGRLAAVKVVLSRDERALGGLRREYFTLRRLHHPGIARPVAEGLEDSPPWYAMEMVEGAGLLEHCRGVLASGGEAPPDATALGRVLGLVRRLCGVLSYLHGEGIVHRDLKPQNVVVRDDGSVVLLDFGMTAVAGGSVGREALDAAGDVVGTLSYMAPEQWRGEYVDARADLYSVGAMLHVLCTGQPPYRTLREYQDPAAAPPRLDAVVPWAPAPLADLVRRLLSRDPAERLGYADDVARALQELGAGGEAGATGGRPYLYRPGLSGRDRDVARVTLDLDGLASARGFMLLVSGESGVGKTRFLLEVARAARRRGVTVLTGEGHPARAPGPLSLFHEPLLAISDRCRAGGPDVAARLVGSRARLLARYCPPLLSLPIASLLPEPPELNPEAARLRLFEALAETWMALAAEAPLLLVLDDLQWADELALGALVHLVSSGRLEGAPMGVLASRRAEEPVPALDRIPTGGALRAMALGRLPAAAVGEMASDMLALRPMPEPLALFLSEQSEGNPFFVAEYLRTAVTAGLLRREAGRWRVGDAEASRASLEALPLPRNVVDLVTGHLMLLSPEARRLLGVASVLGRECDLELLAEAAGIPEPDAYALVAAIVSRQLAEEPVPGTIRFLHDKVREVAYAAVPPGERTGHHRAAADAIVRRHGESPPHMAAELGRHFAEAGEMAAAAPLYLLAARRAADGHALDEAERLYRARLALSLPPAAEAIDAANELGSRVLLLRGRTPDAVAMHRLALRMSRRLGDGLAEARSLRLLGVASQAGTRHAEARRALQGAVGLFEEHGDAPGLALALSSLAQLSLHEGEIAQAAAVYERALAVASGSGDRSLQAEILGSLGVFRWEQGDVAGAAAMFDQALAIHDATGERVRQARVRGNLASLRHNQGRIAEARRLYEDAAAILGEAGDRRAESIVLGNIAICLTEEGRMEDAARMHTRALATARQVGDRRFEARCLASLAVLHHTQGRLTEAAALYEESVALARRVRDRALEGHATGNLGELRQDQGRAVDARRLFARAIRIHRHVGDRRLEAHAVGNLADLRRQQGRLEDARGLAERALGLSREVGDRQGEGLSLCRLATLERLRGRHADAERLAEEARVLLSQVGERQALLAHACETGFQALARGRSAEAVLPDCRRLLAEVGAGPESSAFRAVDALSRAEEAHRRGDTLWQGHVAGDLPAGLRSALTRGSSARGPAAGRGGGRAARRSAEVPSSSG